MQLVAMSISKTNIPKKRSNSRGCTVRGSSVFSRTRWVRKWSSDFGHTRVILTTALFIRLTPTPPFWFRVSVINFENVSQLLVKSRDIRLQNRPKVR